MSILLNLRVKNNKIIDFSKNSEVIIEEYNQSLPTQFGAGPFPGSTCFDFSLNSRLLISNILLYFLGDFTVSYWIKTKYGAWNNSPGWEPYGGDWCVPIGIQKYSNLLVNGNVNWRGCILGTLSVYDQYRVTEVIITDNEWHYIVFCRKDSVSSLYVDGIKYFTLENDNGERFYNRDKTQKIQVGGCDWDRNYGLDGYMDDITFADHCIYTSNFEVPTNYILGKYENRIYQDKTDKIYGICY